MSEAWRYQLAGHEHGPVQFSALVALARSGQLQRNDLVQGPEGGDWICADLIEGLFESVARDGAPRTTPDLQAFRDISEFTIDRNSETAPRPAPPRTIPVPPRQPAPPPTVRPVARPSGGDATDWEAALFDTPPPVAQPAARRPTAADASVVGASGGASRVPTETAGPDAVPVKPGPAILPSDLVARVRLKRAEFLLRVAVALLLLVLVGDLALLWPRRPDAEKLIGHKLGVNDVKFSPDGKTVATASDDASVRLWSSAGQPLRVITGHAKRVTSVAFSPVTAEIASASGDMSIRLWDLATGIEIRAFLGHEQAVSAIAFHPNGAALASVGWDRTLRIWQTQSGELSLSLLTPTVMECVAWSADGRTLATAGIKGHVVLWDAATGQMHRELPGHTDDVKALVYSRDGRLLATAGKDKTIRLQDVHAGQPAGELAEPFQVLDLAFSPDGSRLIVGGFNGEVVIHDVATGKTVRTIEPPSNPLIRALCVDYHPQGGKVAAGGYKALAILWSE